MVILADLLSPGDRLWIVASSGVITTPSVGRVFRRRRLHSADAGEAHVLPQTVLGADLLRVHGLQSFLPGYTQAYSANPVALIGRCVPAHDGCSASGPRR